MGGANLADELEFKAQALEAEIVHYLQEFHLPFTRAGVTDVQQRALGRPPGLGWRREELLANGVRHPPDPSRSGLNQLLRVLRVAKDSSGPPQRKVLKFRGEPAVCAHTEQASLLRHVAVDGYDVWKSREYGAHGAVAFGSLPVYDVRLDLPELPSRGTNTALVTRAHPPPLWHVEAVKEGLWPKLFRRTHPPPCARDYVNFDPRPLKRLQQYLDRRG